LFLGLVITALGTVLVLGGLVTYFHRAGYFHIDWSIIWSVGLIAIGGSGAAATTSKTSGRASTWLPTFAAG